MATQVLQAVIAMGVSAVFLVVLAVVLYPMYAEMSVERRKRKEREIAVLGVEIMGYYAVTGRDGVAGIAIRYSNDGSGPFTVTSHLPDIWGACTVPCGALFEPPVLAEVPFRLASSPFTRFLENWVRGNGGRKAMSEGGRPATADNRGRE